MNVLDLFSGIGGFSLGLERVDFKTVAFCEIEPFCQKVLKKHWPNIPIYNDVRELTKSRLVSDGIGRIDIITGGFPCQDISVAGKQAGIEGERSGLWGELCRIIGDVRPRYAIVENVTALLSGDRGQWFGKILGDLAEIGYDTEWHCIPASELGANHHRDRIWIICYTEHAGWDAAEIREGNQERNGSNQERKEPASESQRSSDSKTLADTNSDAIQRLEQEPQPSKHRRPTRLFSGKGGLPESNFWKVEPGVGRVANGIPGRVDRLKGLGNAVVPQMPELIGRAIMESLERGNIMYE